MGVESGGYVPKEAITGHELSEGKEFNYSGTEVLPALHEMTLWANEEVDLSPFNDASSSEQSSRLDAIREGLESASLSPEQKTWAEGKIEEVQAHIDRWTTGSSM